MPNSILHKRSLRSRATRGNSFPKWTHTVKATHKIENSSVAPPDELAANTPARPPRPASGFVLMNSALAVSAFNSEAARILCYPDPIDQVTAPTTVAEAIRSSLVTAASANLFDFVRTFRSGRRRYFCRALSLGSLMQDGSDGGIALLLERGPIDLVALQTLRRQFNLTQREGEVLAYLLQTMPTTQIANRMKISVHTVKVYVRLIMIKTGTTSRSEILGRLLLSSHSDTLSRGDGVWSAA